MNLSEPEILQALMRGRTRLSAPAWVMVRDTHGAEDIFQNVALKAMTREGSFESDGALLSWVFLTTRREGLDWLRRQRRETVGLAPDIAELLERERHTDASFSPGATTEALICRPCRIGSGQMKL
jgi:RNA polymerase sigma factor (sigma-70 family)